MKTPRLLTLLTATAILQAGCLKTDNVPNVSKQSNYSVQSATNPQSVINLQAGPDGTKIVGSDDTTKLSDDSNVEIRNVPATVYVHPEIKPSFDVKQKVSAMDEILADGKQHSINVVFADGLKFRVRKGEGSYVSESGYGLTSAAGSEKELEQVNALLRKFSVKSIAPMFGAEERSSEKLDEQEAFVESKTKGVDIPNYGSWASIDLHAETKKEEAKAFVLALQELSFVRIAEFVPDAEPAAIHYYVPPSDPGFLDQSSTGSQYWKNWELSSANPAYWWNRHSFGAAWTYNSGAGRRVAVVDTSFCLGDSDEIDYDQAFKRCYWKTWGVMLHNSDVSPNYSDIEKNTHGSTVAHAIGAQANNSIGVSGGAPFTTIIPIKAEGDFSVVARGIQYAYEETGAEVINVSWQLGASITDQNLESIAAMRQVFNAAWANSVTVVYAAGNNSKPVHFDIANFTGAMCVGAVDRLNNFHSTSNYGSRVDMAASGTSLHLGSCSNDGTTYADRIVGGTSYSAPFVSAAAAIIREYASGPQAIRDMLIFTSDITEGVSTTNPGARPMCAGAQGSDGIPKIRVLNAGAAALIAYYYTSTNRIEFYSSAADDRAKLMRSDGAYANQADYPTNVAATYPYSTGLTTVYADTYNMNAMWADSVAMFIDRRLHSYGVVGTPRLQDPNGNIVKHTKNVNTSPPTNAWVNRYTFSF